MLQVLFNNGLAVADECVLMTIHAWEE